MEKYTLDTDFSSLKGSQTYDWMLEFSDMVEEAFAEKDNRFCLLGNLLFMEIYVHTIRKGLTNRNEPLSAILQKALDILWNYLAGYTDPNIFQDFANNLYACILAYNVGEDLNNVQMAFDQNYFADKDFITCEYQVIEWCAGLLIQLVAIEGGQLYREDLQEDLERYNRVDFYGLEEMLNLLENICIDYANISRLSNTIEDIIKAEEQVHQTVLFQQIIKQLQNSLKTALNAKPEQFMSLRNEYQKYSIIPAENSQQFLEYFISI